MSRIIIKSLPKYITKERLHNLFSVYGTITDLRLIYSNGNIFRQIAFVGYLDESEANIAVEKMNNTYIDTSKILVEIAKTSKDESLERPWSKYSEKSSLFQKRIKEKKERLNLIKQFKQDQNKNTVENIETVKKENKNEKHLKMIIESCGLTMEDREKFNEYLKLNKCDDLEILDNLQPEQLLLESENKFDLKNDFSNEQIENVQVFSAKISNLRVGITLKRLLKFFVGFDIYDIRIITNEKKRKTCMAIIDFLNEQDLKKALKLSGKLLKGNNVKITELLNSSKNTNLNQNNIKSIDYDSLLDTGRIFVKNLPQICEEKEIKELFEKFGPVVEINVPLEKDLGKIIGIAFVTFLLPENAVTAYNELDNTIFKGKVLKLRPAKDNVENDNDDNDNKLSGGNYKKEKLKKMKKEASKMSHTWNTLFINQNAVANIISQRLGIDKDKLLTDSNSAVSLAAGETALVNETKHFLETNGVNLDSFRESNEKSDRILLAKNLPENLSKIDFSEFIFKKLNTDDNPFLKPRIIIPPYGITAIIEFTLSQHAKIAFKKLAFTRVYFI